IVEICRRGTRRAGFAPRELRLQATALDAGAGHAAFFGCPIALGASRNALVFAAEDAALPFLTSSPQLPGALLPDPPPDVPSAPASIVARVRALLVERLLGQRPGLRAISGELGMSGRALQRLLKDERTSFRQLLDGVRSQRAAGYLRSTSFSDGE